MKINSYKLYNKLKNNFGKQKWWPIDKEYHNKNCSDPRFEIIIGAILTQNTTWSNVEKALENLKLNKLIEISKIVNINTKVLQSLIKPSGFYNQKADRIKNIARYIYKNYNSDLDLFFNKKLKIIREELLSLNGVGPETADSILLYAGEKPIFVVDAYTKRISNRLKLNKNISYDKIQNYFEIELSNKYSDMEITKIYNELHALIVIFAKKLCKKRPKCNKCPIIKYCSYEQKSNEVVPPLYP